MKKGDPVLNTCRAKLFIILMKPTNIRRAVCKMYKNVCENIVTTKHDKYYTDRYVFPKRI